MSIEELADAEDTLEIESDAPQEETQDIDEPVSETRKDIEAAIAKLETPDDEQEASKEPDKETKKAETEKPQEANDEAPDTKLKTAKAPVGWKGEAKESWSELPEPAKKAIAQRERDIAVTMQQTAQERRLAKQFSDTLLPHRDTLQQLGFKDPISAVSGVMAGVVSMRTGSVQDRAKSAAQMLQAMDIDITALDEALVNQGGFKSSQNSELEALLDKRLAPVNQFMTALEQQQYQAQQQSQQQSVSEVGEFLNSVEFGDVVRHDMADLLDMAAARGQAMTLKEAYDKACAINPSVSEQVDAQKAKTLQEQTRQNTQSKRHASSSVSGRPAGNGEAKKEPETIHDALNAAWDMHSSRRV